MSEERGSERRVRFYYKPNAYRVTLAEMLLSEEEAEAQERKAESRGDDVTGNQTESHEEAEAESAPESAPDPKGRPEYPEILMFLLIVMVSAVLTIINPYFFTWSNVWVIISAVSYLLLIGGPAAWLMMTGDMDLSVGAVASFGAVFYGWTVNELSVPIPLAVAATVFAGVAWGMIKGLIVVKMGVSSVLATMAGCFVWFLLGNLCMNVRTFDIGTVNFRKSIYYFMIERRMMSKGGWEAVMAGLPGILVYIFWMEGGVKSEKTDGDEIRILPHVLVSAMAAWGGICLNYLSFQGVPSVGTGIQGMIEITLQYPIMILSAVMISRAFAGKGKGTAVGLVLGCILVGIIFNSLWCLGVENVYGVKEAITGILWIGVIVMNTQKPAKNPG